MKKHTWADPTKEWEGFRFTAYGLNWEKLNAMPLTLENGQLPPEDHRVVIRDSKTGEFAVAHEPATEERGEEATTEERRLTVGRIYSRLARCKFEVEERPVILRLKVKTKNGGEIVLKGPSFNCAVLREMLALKAEGIEPFPSLWFWYDRDSSRDSPHETYSFFVVSGDKIVREDVSFSDYHDSGFDQPFSYLMKMPIPFGSTTRTGAKREQDFDIAGSTPRHAQASLWCSVLMNRSCTTTSGRRPPI